MGVSGWKSRRGNIKASGRFAKLTQRDVRSTDRCPQVGPSGVKGAEGSDESLVKERITVDI